LRNPSLALFLLIVLPQRQSLTTQTIGKPMNSVLIAWIASMAVCSIYTFILPAWDANLERRKRTNSTSPARQTFSRGIHAHPAA
jgi:hypothetical protein